MNPGSRVKKKKENCKEKMKKPKKGKADLDTYEWLKPPHQKERKRVGN